MALKSIRKGVNRKEVDFLGRLKIRGLLNLISAQVNTNTSDINSITENLESVEGAVANVYNNDFASKNLLIDRFTSQTINGVTLINNNDGTYTINGTATEDTYFNASFQNTYPEGIDLKLIGFNQPNKNIKYVYINALKNNDTWVYEYFRDTDRINKFDYSNYKEFGMGIAIKNGVTVDNEIIKPMLVDVNAFPNVSYSDFQPYFKSNAELTETIDLKLPTPPAEEGTYSLTCAVDSEGVATYSWT